MRRLATALALGLALALAAADRADAQATTNFYALQNNAATTLAAAYTPGSGQLVLQPGAGALFGNPTASNPIRVTCVQATTKSLAIFKATGRTGDTLTGVAVFAVPSLDATADIAFSVGDAVQMRVTAGTLADLHAAVNAAEGKLALAAKGDLLVFGSAYARLPVGTDGQVLTADSSQALGVRWAAGGSGGGSGTVTSVALTAPSILSVAGSPVTTSGTLALTLANQAANAVFAGPASGAAATPTFRSLVAADVPDLSATYAALAAANAFTHGQAVTAASGEVALAARSNGTQDALQVRDSGGTARTAFDKDGYGLLEKVTFVLGQGADLANGTNVTGVGALAGYAGKVAKWKAKAATNGTSGGFSFDIRKNGTSIFAAAQAVAANTTAVQSGGTFAATAVAEGDEFTVDISGAGTGVRSVNITLYLQVRNQ